jgi:YD repeat-containing protein
MKREYSQIVGDSSAANGDWQLSADYTYDDAGHEIVVVDYGVNGQRITAKYDAEGFETLKAIEMAGGAAGSGEYRSVWNDNHTQQTTELFSAADSRVVQKVINKFDVNGTLIASEEEDRRFLEAITKINLRMELDSKGRVSKQFESFDGKELLGIKYTYDDKGNPSKIERMDNEGKPSQIEYYEYNAEGKKTAFYLQDFSAYFKTKQLKAKFEYDSQGRLVREVFYKGLCDEIGLQAAKCPISEVATYTYDAQGRLATEERDHQSADRPVVKKRFEYSGTVPTNSTPNRH